MAEPPNRDVALCIELRERVVMAMMTREDWAKRIDQHLAHWTKGGDDAA